MHIFYASLIHVAILSFLHVHGREDWQGFLALALRLPMTFAWIYIKKTLQGIHLVHVLWLHLQLKYKLTPKLAIPLSCMHRPSLFFCIYAISKYIFFKNMQSAYWALYSSSTPYISSSMFIASGVVKENFKQISCCHAWTISVLDKPRRYLWISYRNFVFMILTLWAMCQIIHAKWNSNRLLWMKCYRIYLSYQRKHKSSVSASSSTWPTYWYSRWRWE